MEQQFFDQFEATLPAIDNNGFSVQDGGCSLKKWFLYAKTDRPICLCWNRSSHTMLKIQTWQYVKQSLNQAYVHSTRIEGCPYYTPHAPPEKGTAKHGRLPTVRSEWKGRTSPTRKRTPTGPYRRPLPRVLGGVPGGWAFSCNGVSHVTLSRTLFGRTLGRAWLPRAERRHARTRVPRP